MRIFSICVLAAMVLGCIPYSDNPLTPPDKGRIDKSVIGTWFWNAENESGYIHIGLDPETKLLRLAMVDMDKDHELEISVFSGHTSALDGNTYLNLKWVSPEQEGASGYLFVKYIAEPGLLKMALMDCDATEKAINSGVLAGKVQKGGLIPGVLITEAPEPLRKFIVANDKSLFPEMVNLQKLKLPDQGMK